MQSPNTVLPLSSPFGLIIPSREVITNFQPADATGTKYTLTIPLPIQSNNLNDSNEITVTSISDVVFFLLPNFTLPPNTGAMLYWSASSNQPNIGTPPSSFELLGGLTPNQASTILSTGWSTNEPLQTLISNLSTLHSNNIGSNPIVNITFGISIESLDNVQNVLQPTLEQNCNDRKNIAHKIALDLFNYLQSFDDTQRNGNGWMNVPTNVFDRWFKRFEMKMGRDPNFFMKCSKE